ncbi:hypothetical protein N184_10000 [Sinorhizobium sp. GL28]|nr:hypothetical protein N183_05070 [Sinorhizobium sp. Sb3]KSV87983.1 hypothetical protein N184_10000 [Sinorhizobium sp. GL28]
MRVVAFHSMVPRLMVTLHDDMWSTGNENQPSATIEKKARRKSSYRTEDVRADE